MSRLNVKLKDLFGYDQQVQVIVGQNVESGRLVHVFSEDKKQLAIHVHCDTDNNINAVHPISIHDIKRIEIAQTQCGNACTLNYAQAKLGLVIPADFSRCYIDGDDLEDDQEIMDNLEYFCNKLNKQGISYVNELEGGLLAIEVDVEDK